MNMQSKTLLRSVMRQLVIALELLNKMPENDFRELVKAAKTKQSDIKGIVENAGRGNIFMIIFFIRELIENILNE
jgi:hypothetical protein